MVLDGTVYVMYNDTYHIIEYIFIWCFYIIYNTRIHMLGPQKIYHFSPFASFKEVALVGNLLQEQNTYTLLLSKREAHTQVKKTQHVMSWRKPICCSIPFRASQNKFHSSAAVFFQDNALLLSRNSTVSLQIIEHTSRHAVFLSEEVQSSFQNNIKPFFNHTVFFQNTRFLHNMQVVWWQHSEHCRQKVQWSMHIAAMLLAGYNLPWRQDIPLN